ncbi:YncE family protein [Nocardia tengchongensis]|uniref:YncE family protein n=1 Tax=Nocardia tengchongensis TaxID=2055889 RepID=UPI003684B146
MIAIVAAVAVYLVRSGSPAGLGPAVQDGAFTVTPVALNGVSMLAVDPRDGTVYGTEAGGKTVWSIDRTTRSVRTLNIELDNLLSDIAVDPVTHGLLGTATSYGKGGNGSPEGVLRMIDPNASVVTATVKVGKHAGALAVDSAGQFAYVGTDEGLSVVDLHARRVVAVVPTGSDISDVAIDPEMNTVYVTDYLAGAIVVVDSHARTVAARIPVGHKAAALAVDSAIHKIYVTDDQGSTVTVVDSSHRTVISTIAVGSGPSGVDVDPSTHDVFVANAHDGTVSVINGSEGSVTSTINVGGRPFHVAVDATTRAVYVSNSKGLKAITPPAAPSSTTAQQGLCQASGYTFENTHGTTPCEVMTEAWITYRLSWPAAGGPQTVSLKDGTTALCTDTTMAAGGVKGTCTYNGSEFRARL